MFTNVVTYAILQTSFDKNLGNSLGVSDNAKYESSKSVQSGTYGNATQHYASTGHSSGRN